MKEHFIPDDEPLEMDAEAQRIVQSILGGQATLEGCDGYVHMDLSQIPQRQHLIRQSLSDLAQRLELAKEPPRKKRPSKKQGNQRWFSYPSGIRKV